MLAKSSPQSGPKNGGNIPEKDSKNFIRRTGQLDIETAVSIRKQACDGLTVDHRLGAVHRDLKPGYSMIGVDGDVRNMDFGIARSVEAPGITATGTMIGTPDDISPEQAEGKSDPNITAQRRSK